MVVPTRVAALLFMSTKVVQQLLDFLRGLAGTGVTLMMDKASRTNVFPQLVLGSIMSGTKHDLLTMFWKMKPPIL